MKIYYSPSSPYVRKCMVAAHELGLADRIQKLDSAASPVTMDMNVAQANPLGKVPTLLTDEGLALFDSRVVCEYLDDLGRGSLFPREGALRWQVLAEQALADGMLDAALLARYEKATRPGEFQWQAWIDGQMKKIANGLQHFEQHVETLADRVDIGTIALACALGYLDFRYADYEWRAAHGGLGEWYAGFSARPSMKATAPG
ncbi:glutathione S-transferase family protein [Allopusillimonas soli]|uniref:Glutathione S-transferase N-terminal domain-containing protein n=1 Tax=Allopusillimonas soli TaxID=659016 RepID=A0A853F5A4_9BURK|nr:glutathione S-transferase N-terminal domain-containing protein [Allopusillimonas soli]NYT35694.1 glutathione S-transferase N-terminal domain-containing protein [Allopusillimonas soli]TEA76085.1 glutathione S-transferase family protein [Allopusillimonas soli]